MTIFQSLWSGIGTAGSWTGQQFKKGWNNGNLSKAAQTTSMIAMGALTYNEFFLKDNNSIWGNHSHFYCGFGGLGGGGLGMGTAGGYDTSMNWFKYGYM